MRMSVTTRPWVELCLDGHTPTHPPSRFTMIRSARHLRSC